MKKSGWFFGVLLAWLALIPACRKEQAVADLVLLGGKVWTGDAGRPWAEAVAVREIRSSRSARRLRSGGCPAGRPG